MRRKFSKKYNQGFLDPDEIFADTLAGLKIGFGSEGKIERSIGKIPSVIFLFLVALGVGYLLFRSVSLQASEGNKFFAKSQENRFLVRPAVPPRGLIYDKYKKPMVENHPSFGVVFEKEEFSKARGNPEEFVRTLAEILNRPPEFFWELGFPEDNNIKKMPARVVIAQGLSPEEVRANAPRLHTIAGVQTFENFRRVYKDPYAFSHLLGFVGKISEEDLARYPNFKTHEVIGKSGIELAYDEDLRGRGGKKIVEVDASGKETRFKLVEEPQEGREMILTIDRDLQQKAYETIQHFVGNTKGASAVAIDPKNGSVLALVSYPGFDANRLGYSISAREFQEILSDSRRPLFNRAISGEFPSGSVIKPLYAAAALQENIIDPNKKIHDVGFIEIPNPYNPNEKSIFVDWKKGGHGWVDFYDAIAQSVNVYFYTIGGGYKDQKGLGIERLKKYANAFGLGSILGIDIPGEKPGLFPDPEWKKLADKQNPDWRVGDTYNVSIGQGGVKVTPLQMAMMTSAIANGGKLYRPYIFNGYPDKNKELGSVVAPFVIREKMVEPKVLEEVKKGMRLTVTEGTARLLSSVSVPVAAKTGTAEAGSGLPHAWVTVFAPADDPKIVMVVMVEHAGEGSTVAVPITNEILSWYFSQDH